MIRFLGVWGAVLLLILQQGCGGAKPAPASNTLSQTSSPISNSEEETESSLSISIPSASISLADRIVQVQNNDGSWDWEQNINDPLTPTQTGFQNVTGVTGLGLFDMLLSFSDAGWENAVQKTADYFLNIIGGMFDASGNVLQNLSCPNWTFLARHLQQFPDAAAKTEVVTAFGKLLDARDRAFGTDVSMRIDGMMQRIVVGRASIPGIIPWDMALCTEAAVSMSQLDPIFAPDAADGLRFLSNYTQNIFLPNHYDPNNAILYGDISLSLSLFVLAKNDTAGGQATLISDLKTRLDALTSSQGLVTNGSDNDGPLQATTYALLAYQQLGDAKASTIRDFLTNQIDDQSGSSTKGAVWNRANNIEDYEVEGEILRALIYSPPPPEENWGTTYYIRSGGGDATQCTGTTDTDYPGTGTGKSCAWKHPFIALPPGGSPRIAGGDRLIISAGSYRMGYGAPGASGCASAFPWDCYIPPIPSGADAAHPTRLYGADWNSGCATSPEFYGAERAARILNLSGSSNVRIDCLEVTDHSGCVEFHSGGLACKRNVFPYGDWAPHGLYAADAVNVTLHHVNIHGLANNGVLAGRLRDWLVDDVRIAANGWAGWNGDISGDDSNSGTLTFRRVVIEWNGCGETFPQKQPTGCWGQSAGGYGDGLGTGTTGGKWIFEDSQFLHNTSDGLDLLYHRGADTITLERVHAEGNAGNQIKTSGTATIHNSQVIGNCGYFQGQPFTFDVDHCRALGNALSLRFDPGNAVSLSDSMIYSEGDCLMLATGESCNGTESFISRTNNFRRAPDFLTPGDRSCLFYSECAGLTLDDAGSTITNVNRGDF